MFSHVAVPEANLRSRTDLLRRHVIEQAASRLLQQMKSYRTQNNNANALDDQSIRRYRQVQRTDKCQSWLSNSSAQTFVLHSSRWKSHRSEYSSKCFAC